MKILLIRHGETTGDVENRYGGSYDDHLTEQGNAQLRETAVSLRGMDIDTIYASPLIRAQESADIINQVLNTKIETIEGLKERDYGVLSGLTKAEALDKYPEAVEAHKNPANTDPEGEPQTNFVNRVKIAYEGIVSKPASTIIILAHGGSLKVILKHLNQPIPGSIGDGEIIEVNI